MTTPRDNVRSLDEARKAREQAEDDAVYVQPANVENAGLVGILDGTGFVALLGPGDGHEGYALEPEQAERLGTMLIQAAYVARKLAEEKSGG